jgi:alkylhydroperoxidase/carboxymuconolactone decarboxylase family protein YurZ
MTDGCDESRAERAEALIARTAIALLAFRGADKAGLVAHMKRAMRPGATREELFEILETCLVPGGAPTFHRGLSALLEVDG